jgi:hypothetical protein
MIKVGLVAAAALGLALMTSAAQADDRLLDGVLGAGAGALVAGPVGLVAGGVIGYSAGPDINCAMQDGCRHYRRYRHRHHD